MLNTTMIKEDLRQPLQAKALRQLQKTALSLFWQGVPFSQQGLLRHRWRINRWSEQWKYTRAIAFVPWRPEWNIIDIGGAASLIVYHLALEGCSITSINEDPVLAETARKFSEEKSLSLAVLEKSLLEYDISEPSEADWVLSLCCLENYSIDKQILICQKLASLLKPGGILTIIFQYGDEALVPNAPHNPEAVQQWVDVSGLKYMSEDIFTDRGKRYAIDGRLPDRQFTYGSLFLVK